MKVKIKKPPLTFKKFQKVNLDRCNAFFDHNLESWSLSDWGCAIAGEVGELCNFIKKMRRGDGDFTKDCSKELGDIVTYAFLIADKLGINLEQVTIDKFNEVSDRIDNKNIAKKSCPKAHRL